MISVCIATYNGASVIREQLDSILPQLGPADEIIISDDDSQDGTVLEILRYKDSRIHIVKGPCTGSPIANFENALRHAHGDYIFLSDQDDKWFQDKVKVCMEELVKGADCVLTDCSVTDAVFRVTAPSFFARNNTHKGKYYNLLRKNGYIGGCMAFSRKVRDAVLPFPEKIPMHDMWIGNVSAFFYSVIFINRPLSFFRRHGHNASTSSQKSSKPIVTRIGYRFWMVYYLFRLALRNKRSKKR